MVVTGRELSALYTEFMKHNPISINVLVTAGASKSDPWYC